MAEPLELAIEHAAPGVLAPGDGPPRVLPRTSAEVATIVRVAREHGGALAPPGSEPRAGAVRVDLSRMRTIAVDEQARIAFAQGGATLAEVEDALAAGGSTLGLVDRASAGVGVATWLALGAPGARDPADDPVDQLVAGADVVLPNGELACLRPAPRRAVGPDWLAAVVGSRGRLGIIVAAHLVARVRYATTTLAFELADARTATALRTELRGIGVRPRATRIVEEAQRSVLVLELAAPERLVRAWREVALRAAAARSGRETAAPRVDSPPASSAGPTAPIIEALARALDPARVLG